MRMDGVTIFHVQEEVDGSTSVRNLATGRLLIRDGLVQPDLSEQEARDAAELITPVRFAQSRSVGGASDS